MCARYKESLTYLFDRLTEMTSEKKLKAAVETAFVNCEIVDYFSQKNIEAYIVNTDGKEDFEIFESMRIYLERVSTFPPPSPLLH